MSDKTFKIVNGDIEDEKFICKDLEEQLDELKSELAIVTAQRDDREEHLVDAMVGAEWVKVTPEMKFEKGFYWVKPVSPFIGVLLAEWDPVSRAFDLDLWSLRLKDVSHVMPAIIPEPPKGDA